jgi:hypothetical protein
MGKNRGQTASTKWITGLALVTGGGLLAMAPAWSSLRQRRPNRIEGIETLNDAVATCTRSNLADWELVLFAQRLVYRKFAYYSCRNLWDTPAQAFRFGMGYCTQYNLAFKRILEQLGIKTQVVTSFKVRVRDNPAWSMGHTWLRVTVRGEVRDVCAGHTDNLPGQVNFSPEAPVWAVGDTVLFLLHLGMIPFCGYLEWRSLLLRRPLPGWIFHAQTHG